MDIVICEDIEKEATSLWLHINRYINEMNCTVNVVLYNSGDKLLRDFAMNKLSDVKIIFLDIYMPGTDGIDTAKKIRESNKDIIIIFTTTSKNHSLEGYSVYALQYLVKPVEYPEVKEVLDICMEKFAASLKFIEVLSGRLTVKVYFKDIMYVEVIAQASYIYTTIETHKTFIPLHELEKQLEGNTFIRTQRSYIVNMSHIKKMTADAFILNNDKEIPIRRSEKMRIKQVYRDYLSALTRD